MKNLRKKLFISMLSMVLMFITLGTTTFAWVTLSTEATFKGATASLAGPNGLEFSEDGLNWKNEIDLSSQDIVFHNVTTENGHDFTTFGTKIEKEDEEDVTKYASNVEFINASSNYYYNKKLHIRVTSETDLVSDGNSISIYVDQFTFPAVLTNNWALDTNVSSGITGLQNGIEALENKLNAVGSIYAFDALNAIRVSFVPYGNISASDNKLSDSYSTTINDFNIPNEPSASIFAFENIEPTVSAYVGSHGGAVGYAASSKGIAQLYLENKGYTLSTTNHTDPATIKEGYTISRSDSNPLVSDKDSSTPVRNILSKTNFYYSEADNTANVYYYYAIVDVNIWLEGWDADCLNAILGSDNITIGFILKLSTI